MHLNIFETKNILVNIRIGFIVTILYIYDYSFIHSIIYFWNGITLVGTCYVVRAYLKQLVLLPLLPDCWAYKHALPCCIRDGNQGFFACNVSVLLNFVPSRYFVLTHLYPQGSPLVPLFTFLIYCFPLQFCFFRTYIPIVY